MASGTRRIHHALPAWLRLITIVPRIAGGVIFRFRAGPIGFRLRLPARTVAPGRKAACRGGAAISVDRNSPRNSSPGGRSSRLIIATRRSSVRYDRPEHSKTLFAARHLSGRLSPSARERVPRKGGHREGSGSLTPPPAGPKVCRPIRSDLTGSRYRDRFRRGNGIGLVHAQTLSHYRRPSVAGGAGSETRAQPGRGGAAGASASRGSRRG